MMKNWVRLLFLVNFLVLLPSTFAQQSFRPFGTNKNISLPSSSIVPTATPMGGNGFLVNPALFQPTSFGNLDCQYYTFFESQMYWNQGAGLGSLSGCQNFAANYNMPATSQSPLAGQLGERENIDATDVNEFISSPRVRRAAWDPYGEYTRHVNTTLSGPTSASCPAGNRDEDANPPVDLSRTLTLEERERLFGDLEEQPGWLPTSRGLGRLVELPEPENDEEERRAGYYRYNDGDEHVYATERVEWNIRAAGRVLAEQNILMGVGELSARNGETPGHTEHQGGRDVDLRLIGPTQANGFAEAYDRACTVSDSSCYDRDNTFKMIKAFIDVDPFGIDKIFINDSDLRTMINNYFRDTYGISSFNGNKIAQHCGGHDNHVHLSFKNNGSDPDVMARRAGH